jgi:hypothetical protein
MAQDFYAQALFAARAEREKLRDEQRKLDLERAELEMQIIQLDETIRGLALLSGDVTVDQIQPIKGLDKLGLADACRKILAANDRYMTPSRIRQELIAADYDLSKQSNPLASIHAILKRFKESGEAESLRVAGRNGFRLKRKNKTDLILSNPPYMTTKKSSTKKPSQKRTEVKDLFEDDEAKK